MAARRRPAPRGPRRAPGRRTPAPRRGARTAGPRAPAGAADAGEDHLDARLGDHLGLADPAERGPRALERPEASLADGREGAPVVVPDGACPRRGERGAYGVRVLVRDEDDQLVEAGVLVDHHLRVHDPEGPGERLVHAVRGHVGVGVRREEGGAAAHQGVHDASLGRRGRHAVHGREQQGVVADQQVGAPLDGLGHDGGRRVDGEQHPADRLGRVAAHQSDGVPVRGPGRVVPPVQQGGHVREAQGHGGEPRGDDFPIFRGRSGGGRSRDRTCDHLLVREVLYR